MIEHRTWGGMPTVRGETGRLGCLRFVCYNMGDSARVLIFYVLASGMPGQLREQHQVDVVNVADLAVRKASEDEWQIFFISKVRVKTHVTLKGKVTNGYGCNLETIFFSWLPQVVLEEPSAPSQVCFWFHSQCPRRSAVSSATLSVSWKAFACIPTVHRTCPTATLPVGCWGPRHCWDVPGP